MANPYSEVNRRSLLIALVGLKRHRFGWDGKDALPVRPDAYEVATRSLLAEGGIADVIPSGADMGVTMGEDGTVILAFGHGRRDVVLQVHCGEAASYVQAFGDGQIEGTIRIGSDRDVSELREVVAWIGGGREEADPV